MNTNSRVGETRLAPQYQEKLDHLSKQQDVHSILAVEGIRKNIELTVKKGGAGYHLQEMVERAYELLDR